MHNPIAHTMEQLYWKPQSSPSEYLTPSEIVDQNVELANVLGWTAQVLGVLYNALELHGKRVNHQGKTYIAKTSILELLAITKRNLVLKQQKTEDLAWNDKLEAELPTEYMSIRHLLSINPFLETKLGWNARVLALLFRSLHLEGCYISGTRTTYISRRSLYDVIEFRNNNIRRKLLDLDQLNWKAT